MRLEEELGEDTYLFSARFDVEYLNQAYKLQILSDSYGGRLYCRFHKDSSGRGYHNRNYHFVIEEATNKKIELVKMTVKTDFFSKSFFAK
jgi:hypothetical protein